MKPLITLFTAGLMTIAFLADAQTVFRAELSGRSEVQPVATTGDGFVEATLDGDTLTIEGMFEQLLGDFDPNVAGGSHIHIGYAGENGPIEITLNPTLGGDLKSGIFEADQNTFILNADQKNQLMTRQMYVNIHSTLHQGGEIRGQLQPAADAFYSTNLFGNNEVPSIMTEASGALVMELQGDTLWVSGSFSNMSTEVDTNIAGGAHLHMAAAGSNGPVIIPLEISLDSGLVSGHFEASENMYILTPDQMQALENRMVYANLHTLKFPSGELRGQVVGTPNVVFRAHLAGANEWPLVTSNGSGQVIAELDGDQLLVSGSFSGLESEIATEIAGGAHIHLAPAGLNGAVIIPLELTIGGDSTSAMLETAFNDYTLDAGQVVQLYERGTYVNIHSDGHQSGEIRGQLLPECKAVFTAFLSGSQEIPDVLTTGHGMIKAEYNGSQMILSGGFAELGTEIDETIAGGAHIHNALPGSNGGIAFPIELTFDADSLGAFVDPDVNIFGLNEDQRGMLKSRAFYANIHTLDHPSGELRGNLLAEARAYFLAPLSGASEASPVNTAAQGMAAIELNGNSATLVGSFNDLESDFAANIAGGAHIHTQMAGLSGGILYSLSSNVSADLRSGSFEAADNRFPMSGGTLDTLRMRGMYVNVHTADHPSGELRGQILPLAGGYLHSSLKGINEVQPVISDASGGVKLELVNNVLTLSGGFNMLESPFDPDIAGGSHLHIGAPGTNGGIAITLNPELSADLMAGVYLADSNSYVLTANQMEALRSGEVYVNIHSEERPSGELRGQVLPEINMFPTESTILDPAGGIQVVLEGAGSTEVALRWEESEDPDGNALTYVWQIAADENFEILTLQRNLGSDTVQQITYQELDSILAENDIPVGFSMQFYHRIGASDGSNVAFGPAEAITFERGEVTAIDKVLASKIGVNLYPTVNKGERMVLEVTAREAAKLEINVIDNTGRSLIEREVNVQRGYQTFEINGAELDPGMYYVTLRDGQGWIPALKFVRQ